MFCPSCGAEYQIELKYCNRCGANLSALTTAPATEVVSVDLTKAVATIGTTLAVVTVAGFLAVIIGASKLAERAAMSNDTIIALIVMGMFTILTTDVFLIRQLSRLISASLTSSISSPKRVKASPAAPQLPKPDTARLEPAPSVTENTTRFLESDYRAPEPHPAEKRNT